MEDTYTLRDSQDCAALPLPNRQKPTLFYPSMYRKTSLGQHSIITSLLVQTHVSDNIS